MKKRTAIKRILAFMTAPAILLAAPRTAWSEWEHDGAAVFVLSDTNDGTEEFAFLGDTFFFGESTTAHLARKGGVLDTPLLARHVWRDTSGTRMLDGRILSSSVDYIDPNGSMRKLSLEEALLCEQPRHLILSFGLNGILYFHKHTDVFLRDYRRLILCVKELSPRTEILLQTVYPVGENTVFSESKGAINAYIEALNTSLSELSSEIDGITLVNTATILRDEHGSLKKEYDLGDGIHLTNEAYREILRHLAPYLKK